MQVNGLNNQHIQMKDNKITQEMHQKQTENQINNQKQIQKQVENNQQLQQQAAMATGVGMNINLMA